MNLLSIIIILLAVVTAGSIAFIAWELSSGRPVFKKREPDTADADDDTGESGTVSGEDRRPPE